MITLSRNNSYSRSSFTTALLEHCTTVLRRLAGETANAAPVTSFITQFGGGKTYTLTALYHLARNGNRAAQYDGIDRLLGHAKLAVVPKARVAVFVGNAWDPQDGKETPWLDMARQIGGETGIAALGQYPSGGGPPCAGGVTWEDRRSA